MKGLLWILTISIILGFISCDPVKIKKICKETQPENCLYLKRRTRGLNYAVVAIDNSTSRTFDHQSKNMLVCNGLFDDLLYKLERDTLFIFTYYSWKGSLQNPSIPISVIDTFDNPQFMRLKEQADSLGIEKF